MNIEENLKYYEVTLNKKGIHSEESISKICKGKQIVGCLNSIWRDKNIYLGGKQSS